MRSLDMCDIRMNTTTRILIILMNNSRLVKFYFLKQLIHIKYCITSVARDKLFDPEPSGEELEKAKRVQYLTMQSSRLLSALFFHGFYCFLLMAVIFSNHDVSVYRQNHHLNTLFDIKTLNATVGYILLCLFMNYQLSFCECCKFKYLLNQLSSLLYIKICCRVCVFCDI